MVQGEWAQSWALEVTVKGFNTSAECREGWDFPGPGPVPGAKLVYVWIGIKTRSDRVVELPRIITELDGVDGDSSSSEG